MDAVKSVGNANEEDEVHPKCDVHAAKSVVDEVAKSEQDENATGKAAAAKNISECQHISTPSRGLSLDCDPVAVYCAKTLAPERSMPGPWGRR